MTSVSRNQENDLPHAGRQFLDRREFLGGAGMGLATLCRALFNSNEFLFVP